MDHLDFRIKAKEVVSHCLNLKKHLIKKLSFIVKFREDKFKEYHYMVGPTITKRNTLMRIALLQIKVQIFLYMIICKCPPLHSHLYNIQSSHILVDKVGKYATQGELFDRKNKPF